MAINSQSFSLSESLAAPLETELEVWSSRDKLKRLWDRDPTLWTASGEERWLGWLEITRKQLAEIARFQDLSQEVSRGSCAHILLIGLGGSSLGAEVVSRTFSRLPAYPDFSILDSTDPAAVRAATAALDLGRTWFIVASKSGTTLESHLLMEYFFDRLSQQIGPSETGRRFIAITDSGSDLQQTAEERGFRRLFLGRSDIGGRFSALSDFGMVPAAAMGLDVQNLLERAELMVDACRPSREARSNPGLSLGLLLGLSARSGRDKVTIFASPGMSGFGAWLEQLLAESTGKQNTGLIPVDGEAVESPGGYGNDRLFVYFRLRAHPDDTQDCGIAALEQAGQPVIRIELNDSYDLGQEFFRWEFATAVLGSSLGVNPFDQPDVEASKAVTRKLMEDHEKGRPAVLPSPILETGQLQAFAEGGTASVLAGDGSGADLAECLRRHLDCLGAGDFFAILAYLERNPEHEACFREMRRAVQVEMQVATAVGFGPRFLHSTGQAYKGGPNTGVFLQITADPSHDVPVPGYGYTFGAVEAAQAQGDFEVMTRRNRRILWIHIGGSLEAGLDVLRRAFLEAAQG